MVLSKDTMLYSPSPVTSTIDFGNSGEPWSEASCMWSSHNVRPTSAAPADSMRKSAPQSFSATRKTLSRYMLLFTVNWNIHEAVARRSNAHNISSSAFTKFKAAESFNAPSSSR
uniref:Uncharacterized protein n=1 Tax=Arundo donax TaxID=35708 RepID=A0A0A9HE95_ARUDO